MELISQDRSYSFIKQKDGKQSKRHRRINKHINIGKHLLCPLTIDFNRCVIVIFCSKQIETELIYG